jgi:2-polyprenyl-6-methoxyphenol hydroxylase-like FAD-dependent oxidoreductase
MKAFFETSSIFFFIIHSLLITMTATSALLSTAGTRRQAAIVGGSLGGLAAAHALSQTGWSVDVYERSPTKLGNKGSGLGFVHNPSWESLTGRPMMRRNRRASRNQGSYYYGDLWNYLYHGLLDSSNNSTKVKVHFDKPITDIQGVVQAPVIDGKPYNLVVLADGGFSKLRQHVLADHDDDDATPEYAGYVVWRGSVSTSKSSSQQQRDFQYLEGVYKNGIYDTIVLKMGKDNGEDLWTIGTFVATPEADVSQFWDKDKDGASRHSGSSNNDKSEKKEARAPSWFLIHMTRQFGHVPHLASLVQQIVQQGELQAHPQYEFGNTNKVHKGRVLLLGDAAHMASPRTAVGAHTAILDALALRDAMELAKDDDEMIDEALKQYSYAGVAHARQLYARSREVSQEFAPRESQANVVSPEDLYPSSSFMQENYTS